MADDWTPDWDYCPNCNAPYRFGHDHCERCGNTADSMRYKCAECGFLSDTADHVRCPGCGCVVGDLATVDSQPGGPGRYRYLDPGAARLRGRSLSPWASGGSPWSGGMRSRSAPAQGESLLGCLTSLLFIALLVYALSEACG